MVSVPPIKAPHSNISKYSSFLMPPRRQYGKLYITTESVFIVDTDSLPNDLTDKDLRDIGGKRVGVIIAEMAFFGKIHWEHEGEWVTEYEALFKHNADKSYDEVIAERNKELNQLNSMYNK